MAFQVLKVGEELWWVFKSVSIINILLLNDILLLLYPAIITSYF